MSRLLLKLRRSITARLLVVFLITSLLLMVVVLATILHGLASQWRANARPHLEQYLDFVRAEIGNPPSIENARALADRLPVNIYIIGPDTNYSTNGEALDVDDDDFHGPSYRRKNGFRENRQGTDKIEFSGDENRTLLRSRVGAYNVYYELLHRQNAGHRRNFIVPALLTLLGILAICYLIIRRMLRPVKDIKSGVKLMGGGDLAHRVPVRSKNDLGELAVSINTMASDIEQMLDSKRQLLLGASHELRSPLTRAKIALQLLDESRESQLLEEDLKEMEDLVSGILESERMKSGHASLNRSPVELEELTRSVIAEMKVDNVTVTCRSPLPLIAVDDTRIRILLRNLIGNAISYNDNSIAPVSVDLLKTEDSVDLTVVDSGPGIAAEHLQHVTEPFYRTDASRTRSTGGFGLGLHLAKLICDAHGGELTIRSRTEADVGPDEQTGTVVTLSLPSDSMVSSAD